MRSEMEMFKFYKDDLMGLAEDGKCLRMNVIEYVCSFPNLDPVLMAKDLVKEGIEVLFDDTSIKPRENERKRRLVMGTGK